MNQKAAAAVFQSECEKAFRFLETDHGFTRRPHPKKSLGNPFEVEYTDQVIFVRVQGTGYGSGVSVRLGRLRREDWEAYSSYDLEDLIAIRSPTQSLVVPGGFSVSKDQMLQLNHYSHVLKEQALDVFSGDLSVFRQLHEAINRRAEEFARREA